MISSGLHIEFDLLVTLVEVLGVYTVCSFWTSGVAYEGYSGLIVISELRRNETDLTDPKYIITVYGVGYKAMEMKVRSLSWKLAGALPLLLWSPSA
jgi:DNA-binding response OmpR family regulator